ncbi:MAG TPA: helix-turn-helix domain-containing protein [Acidobacteriota bacterium]|nr:helix-turn-helix domain-containing protein [Acidobacteriota bacterium]
MSIGPTRSYGLIIPKADYINSLVRQGTISREAKKRLQWMDHYHKHGNARFTCRYFGISAQTFYRWKNRFDRYDLTTLEERSRKPHKVRQPETPEEIQERIRELRNRYPRWGKDKLVVLLRREGIKISASTVGRVINRLKKRGLLVEPVNAALAKRARKRGWKPRYAIRKPKGYKIQGPGDLVEVDTLKVTLIPNEIRYQFSARDVVVKFDGMRAYKSQTSMKAAHFLQYLQKKFPFKIKAIQIDGGSEFKKYFEEECKRREITLFELPPRSPKLNGHVERSNRTSREEFYEVKEIELSIEKHNKQLEQWEYVYNYIRPHQSLDYLTPNEYYQMWLNKQNDKCH